jgi:hypothetical protein
MLQKRIVRVAASRRMKLEGVLGIQADGWANIQAWGVDSESC